MIPETFTVSQLAVAWEIHRDTVLQMIRDGKLHAVRVGRTYRIPVEAVEEFLKGKSAPPPELHSTVVGISPATAARFRKKAGVQG